MVEPAATGEGLVEAHHQALEHTRGYVAGVAASQWGRATPCESWDVRALVDHITSGNLWVPELTAGRTIEEVGDRLDGDQLGADPLEAYDVSARAADAAWHVPGVLSEPVAVSYGPVPGEVYLGHRYLDVLVHGWDLAAATGQDRLLPTSLVDAAWGVLEPQLEVLEGSGMFGEQHVVSQADDPQQRLLHALGRHPDWSAPS